MRDVLIGRIGRGAALQGCPAAVSRPEGLRYERPPFSRARIVLLAAGLAAFAPALDAAPQSHTLVVLSHSNHTVYEVDPASGQILHQFVAPDQPHEGAIASDGGTIFASVPGAAF